MLVNINVCFQWKRYVGNKLSETANDHLKNLYHTCSALFRYLRTLMAACAAVSNMAVLPDTNMALIASPRRKQESAPIRKTSALPPVPTEALGTASKKKKKKKRKTGSDFSSAG